MTRLSIALPCLLWCACAVESSSPPADLMEGTAEVQGVKGLERLEGTGPYLAGQVERFRVHVDDSQVARLEWSASGGSLSASGRVAEWKLPLASAAQLTVYVVRRDGAVGSVTWQFAVTPAVDSNRPMTAQAALLAMPMPVLDGGSLEVADGACEVRYEGTTNNVAIAFTTARHPALMYGRWNGSAWSLEVVDALGFNTGGLITQHVSMQVEANGTPHLVYVRENTVMYATKAGASWVRERVDSVATPYGNVSSGLRDETDPSIALNGATPSVLYITGDGYSASPYRPVIATRTGANAWTRAVVPGTVANTNNVYPWGELAIDSTGRHLFAVADETISNRFQLLAWTPTSRATVQLTPQVLNTRAHTAFAGANRLLMRTYAGVFDFTLASTFTSTTMTHSNVEVGGSSTGDVHWSAPQARPVLLHEHGTALELVTPNAAGFWTYTQLGTSSGVSAGLTVHPTTGEASLCYEANNRIMFQ